MEITDEGGLGEVVHKIVAIPMSAIQGTMCPNVGNGAGLIDCLDAGPHLLNGQVEGPIAISLQQSQCCSLSVLGVHMPM